eukprot:2870441-Amphidinium_carterae.1
MEENGGKMEDCSPELIFPPRFLHSLIISILEGFPRAGFFLRLASYAYGMEVCSPASHVASDSHGCTWQRTFACCAEQSERRQIGIATTQARIH